MPVNLIGNAIEGISAEPITTAGVGSVDSLHTTLANTDPKSNPCEPADSLLVAQFAKNRRTVSCCSNEDNG